MCPPGVIQDENLLKKEFDYLPMRALDLDLLPKNFSESKSKPSLLHIFTLDKATELLPKLMKEYPKLNVIIFGFHPAGISLAVDALTKGDSYNGYFLSEELKPAKLNKYFQE